MAIDGHTRVRNTDPMLVSARDADALNSPAVDVEVVLPGYARPTRAASTAATLELIEESFSPQVADDFVVRDVAEASFGGGVHLEVVIGRDDRVRVVQPQIAQNPWRQICALRISAATGGEFVGTGWFIAPNVLATAGHCVYLHDEGGWPTEIVVVPGKDGASEPFGRATSRSFASVHGWVTQRSRDFDYGVIFLDDSLGAQVGNLGVESQFDTEPN